MKQSLVCWITALFLCTGVMHVDAKSMSVQVQSGQLRERPSPFGKVVDLIPYGERLEIKDEQSPWLLVETADGKAGWMHESMLTRKKLKPLSAGDEDVARAASSEELAMAGKGFNSKVEADFKEKNQDVDFGPIDRMEKIRVDDGEIIEFLEEGGLAQ
jgi:hypothetical protein